MARDTRPLAVADDLGNVARGVASLDIRRLARFLSVSGLPASVVLVGNGDMRDVLREALTASGRQVEVHDGLPDSLAEGATAIWTGNHFDLAGYAPAAELAYLPDVPRLEWAWHRSCQAADAAPLDLDALGAIPAPSQGGIRFRLHPSVQLLRSAHPVASILEGNQEGRDGTPEGPLGP